MPKKIRFPQVLWAFVAKDLRDRFRFKISVFSGFFHPVLTMISFLVVYASVFLVSPEDNLGFVDKSNYVVYLLTGFLAYSIFSLSWSRTSLAGEKLMLTLEGILLAPVTRYFILIGKAVQASFEILVTVAIFVALIILINPQVDLSQLLLGIFALLLLFIIFISFDFLVSGIEIAHEGWASLIRTYGPRAVLILGAVYFPSAVIPEIFKPLIYINPLFYATNFFRLAFDIPAELPFGVTWPLVYLIVLSIVVPFVAITVFEIILRRWGIKGY